MVGGDNEDCSGELVSCKYELCVGVECVCLILVGEEVVV